MSNSSSNHQWADLPSQLSGAIEKANKAAQDDGQLSAFLRTDGIKTSATFGIKGAGSDNAILTTVSNGKVDIRTGTTKDAEFTLSALPEQWQEFFKQTPVMPYQSYWGVRRQSVRIWDKAVADGNVEQMFGMNIKQEGIEVQGDEVCATGWRSLPKRGTIGLPDHRRTLSLAGLTSGAAS
jgi:hypothetical protein